MGKTNFLKKYFSLFIGILTSTSLFASAPDTLWTRTYGVTGWDERGKSVQQTFDGGFIIVGMIDSFGAGDRDGYIIKTNSSGDTLWTKTVGGAYDDACYSVQQTKDSGFVFTGFIKNDAYLLKTNSSGNTLWTKIFSGMGLSIGNSIQQTKDGGFIIAGSTCSFGSQVYHDVYLIKTDSLGDTLWTRTFGGVYHDYAYSVQQTSDGGFIVGGLTDTSYDFSSVYLIRTDSLGDTLWTKIYGGEDCFSKVCRSVQQAQDNGFIVAGYTSKNSFDVYLLKTNSSGDTLWTKTFGGAYDDEGYSIQSVSGGTDGFIIAGYKCPSAITPADVYLVRINPLGDTLWTKTIGGNSISEWGESVQQTQDGGFIIAGSKNYSGAADIYLIRLKSETGVEENADFRLGIAELKISKNPITNFANISYAIPSQCKVELSIYDITGDYVKTLLNEQKPAGSYSINLDAKELKAGIYFVRLTTICHLEHPALAVTERSEESNMIKVKKKITIIR